MAHVQRYAYFNITSCRETVWKTLERVPVFRNASREDCYLINIASIFDGDAFGGVSGSGHYGAGFSGSLLVRVHLKSPIARGLWDAALEAASRPTRKVWEWRHGSSNEWYQMLRVTIGIVTVAGLPYWIFAGHSSRGPWGQLSHACSSNAQESSNSRCKHFQKLVCLMERISQLSKSCLKTTPLIFGTT